jgi:hypothetical protein
LVVDTDHALDIQEVVDIVLELTVEVAPYLVAPEDRVVDNLVIDKNCPAVDNLAYRNSSPL